MEATSTDSVQCLQADERVRFSRLPGLQPAEATALQDLTGFHRTVIRRVAYPYAEVRPTRATKKPVRSINFLLRFPKMTL